jgi:hypothetical protein
MLAIIASLLVYVIPMVIVAFMKPHVGNSQWFSPESIVMFCACLASLPVMIGVVIAYYLCERKRRFLTAAMILSPAVLVGMLVLVTLMVAQS